MIKLQWKGSTLFFSISLIILFLTAWYFLVPHQVKIAAGKKDGDSYKFAQLLKEIVGKYSFPKIHVEVVETDGTQQNLEKLKNKQVDLGVAQADLLAMPDSVRKQLNLQPINLSSTRLISVLFPDAYQLIVRGDAGIQNITDLRGKRILQPPEQGGQIQSFYFLTEHYGLSNQDYQLIKISSDQEIDAFCANQVQAIFHVRAIGNEKTRRLLTQCPTAKPQLLAIDQAGALRIKNPYLESTIIPKGAYRGENPIPAYSDSEPNKQLTTVQVQRLLLAHKDVDADIVRRITEVLYEHRQDFIQKMELPLAAYITSPREAKVDIVATHRGAQWYYNREQPSWLEQNSGSLEVGLGIMLPLFGWFWWLLKQLEQARKDKADDYIREVTALMDAEDSLHTLVELANNSSLDMSNQGLETNWQVSFVIDKIAKILVEKYDAEIARSRGLISQESVISFSKTLRRVVKVLEQSPNELANYIFMQIPERAMIVGRDRQKRQSRKNLIPALIGFNPSLPAFPGKKPSPVANNLTYQTVLNQAKTPTNSTPTQIITFDWQFITSESKLIRADLEAIFKRAVNALVEERITQGSFQAFRGIWQIAVDEVDTLMKGQTSGQTNHVPATGTTPHTASPTVTS